MRIAVDLDLCQGHGVCVSEAPALFELDREKVRVLNDRPAPELRAAARLAAKYCPTRAIRIQEEK
jgi:ferredoxin